MLVRYEEIKKSDWVLVIDENDKFLGEMLILDFIDCIDKNTNPLFENDFEYWTVDKNNLNKFFR